MKTTLVLAAVLGLTFGAPAENISTEIKAEVQRTERSYGPLPCGGAGGYAGAGGFASAPSFFPQAPQALPQSPLPQYREHEKHEESNNARSYYEPSLPALPVASGGIASGASSILGPAPSPAFAPAHSSGGSAVGVFPNAKVGGCNVPLLLSCSPQVVAGHLSESHYSAPSYKHVEEAKRETRNTEPSNARVASHHKVSEDYPEPQDPHPGSHHTISKDYPEPNLTVLVQPQNLENKKGLEKN